MARWRNEPTRVEPPEWYRNYHPEAWGEMDAQEISMTAGWTGPWPEWLHDHHSRRRWAEAKHAYRQEHPLLATQEFQELIARNSKRRSGTL